MKGGTSKMNKRIASIIDSIKDQVLPDKDILTQQLFDKKIHTLVSTEFSRVLNFSLQEIQAAYLEQFQIELNMREQKHKFNQERKESTPEFDSQYNEIQTIVHILNLVYKIRNEIRTQRGQHPILNQHIENNVFNVTTPKNNELALNIDAKGHYKEVRITNNKKLYFENLNGNILTEYDHRVLSAICKIFVDNGHKEKIAVDLSDILSELKIPFPSGGDYEALRNSINDLLRTMLVFEESVPGSFEGDTDTQYDLNYIFKRLKFINKEFTRVEIYLQDYISDALQQGDYFNINMYLINDFKTKIAKALYKFLLSQFTMEKREYYEFDFDSLRHHLILDQKNQSRTRKHLCTALDDLRTNHFIESFLEIKMAKGVYHYRIYSKEDSPSTDEMNYAQLYISK